METLSAICWVALAILNGAVNFVRTVLWFAVVGVGYIPCYLADLAGKPIDDWVGKGVARVANWLNPGNLPEMK